MGSASIDLSLSNIWQSWFLFRKGKKPSSAIDRFAFNRDRIVHRLLYEYLTKIYDKTFIYDAWSCRKNKGVIGAINRVQRFLLRFPSSYFWRADIRKFFNSVDQNILKQSLRRKLSEPKDLFILDEIINSYSVIGAEFSERERERELSALIDRAAFPSAI